VLVRETVVLERNRHATHEGRVVLTDEDHEVLNAILTSMKKRRQGEPLSPPRPRSSGARDGAAARARRA
jgi:hypothetical protein